MQYQTFRPEDGWLFHFVQNPSETATRFLAYMLEKLDGNEGWVSATERGAKWYVSNLALDISVEVGENGLTVFRFEMEVARDIEELTGELLFYLNDLNLRSVGGWYWYDYDNDRILSTFTVPISASAWWWMPVVRYVVPFQIALAHLWAPFLVSIGNGTDAQEVHPDRGARPDVDSWVDWIRRGSARQWSPSNLIGNYHSQLDLTTLQRVLAASDEIECSIVNNNFEAHVRASNSDQLNYYRVAQDWDREIGWAWQFTLFAGHADSAKVNLYDWETSETYQFLSDAAQLNYEQGLARGMASYFGSWIAIQDVGIVHHTSIPAHPVNEIISSSSISKDGFKTSAGSILTWLATQIYNATAHRVDFDTLTTEHCESFLKAAPLTFPDQPFGERSLYYPVTSLEEPLDYEAWLLPRQRQICNFGYLNDRISEEGPTISSVELAFDQEGLLLLQTITCAEKTVINLLGRISRWDEDGNRNENIIDEFAELVVQAFAGKLNSEIWNEKIDWLNIPDNEPMFRDAVLAGVTSYVEQHGTPDLWGERAYDLFNYAAMPDWFRSIFPEVVVGEVISRDDLMNDPRGYYVEAITSPVLSAIQHLYVDILFQGARLRDEGREVMNREEARLAFKVFARVIADLEFRNYRGGLVQPPEIPIG